MNYYIIFILIYYSFWHIHIYNCLFIIQRNILFIKLSLIWFYIGFLVMVLDLWRIILGHYWTFWAIFIIYIIYCCMNQFDCCSDHFFFINSQLSKFGCCNWIYCFLTIWIISVTKNHVNYPFDCNDYQNLKNSPQGAISRLWPIFDTSSIHPFTSQQVGATKIIIIIIMLVYWNHQ